MKRWADLPIIAQVKVQARLPLIPIGIALRVLEAGPRAQAQFAVLIELIADLQMEHAVYEKLRAEITSGQGLIITVIEPRVVRIVMIYLQFREGGKSTCFALKEMDSGLGLCADQSVIVC